LLSSCSSLTSYSILSFHRPVCLPGHHHLPISSTCFSNCLPAIIVVLLIYPTLAIGHIALRVILLNQNYTMSLFCSESFLSHWVSMVSPMLPICLLQLSIASLHFCFPTHSLFELLRHVSVPGPLQASKRSLPRYLLSLLFLSFRWGLLPYVKCPSAPHLFLCAFVVWLLF
jgi:hypothetical protein